MFPGSSAGMYSRPRLLCLEYDANYIYGRCIYSKNSTPLPFIYLLAHPNNIAWSRAV